MNFGSYDFVLVNSSAGKDSQAMLEVVASLARLQGALHKVVVVHADLGRMEWPGTRELAEYHARCRGLRFEVVSREQNLLAQVEARGMWPDSGNRYCTSDHKRDQVSKLLTRLTREAGGKARILNCMGLRADESPARAKKVPFARNERASNTKRTVDDWLPIHEWSEADVWERIRLGGMPHHYAYDLGMPRLSCCFCVFASPAALLIAGFYNRNLLRAYAGAEGRMGHTFRNGFTIASTLSRLDAGELPPERAENWLCA